MRDTIDMAREAGDDWDSTLSTDKEFLKRFEAIVPADERAASVQEPDGYVYGNSYWEATNPRITDDVKRFGSPRYATSPAQPAVPHPVIAGMLFDFMGWLTSREARLTLSSTDDASPAVEAITEFAKMRGLSLDDARVHDWQDGITKGQP
jgi:hypothetical protein